MNLPLLIEFLQSSPFALIVSIGLLGLLIGSFLNVVIYRLPVMLDNIWRYQCCELLAENNSPPKKPPVFNLITPRSQCPHCHALIKALQNIPVLSFLYLRGKCANCHGSISLRYPLLECISALIAMTVAYKFGFSWQMLGALLLSWSLLSLSVIDLDHYLLPDNITLPFLWLGLLCNTWGLYTNITAAVIGCVAGYLILWSIYWLFKLVTGKEGMGYGDFKLLAMLGAWLGWQKLLPIILLSSAIGALVGIACILLGKHRMGQPMPFGPYLAAAGWVTLLWGDEMIVFYLTWIGG